MKLSDCLESEGLGLSSASVEKLEIFASLLYDWNRIHNLTGAKSIDAIYSNIIDSLYPLTFIKRPKTLLDVGTGAGFPGLVLAIVLNECKVVLTEPIRKRVSFLKYVAMDIGLEHILIEPRRVEDIEHNPFGLVTSRAVSNTGLLLRLTQKVSDNHTEYLFYKGSRVFDEVADIEHKLEYDIVQKNHRNYLYIKGQA